MRLVCVNHNSSPEFRPTEAGQAAWLDWLQFGHSGPVEVRLDAEGGVTRVPDFARTTLSALALSPRALDLVGHDAFKLVAPMAVPCGPAYSIGICRGTKAFMAMSGMKPVLPLQLKPGAESLQGRIYHSSTGFTLKLKGDYFMLPDVWSRIEAAGLTGFVKVGEYEVSEE